MGLDENALAGASGPIETGLEAGSGGHESEGPESRGETGDRPMPGDATDSNGAGDPTEGDPTGGDPTNGDPTNGDPTNGDPTNGDPTNGDPTNGDPTNGDPTSGDPTNGDPTDGDPTDGDPTDGDPTDGDPTGGEIDPGTDNIYIHRAIAAMQDWQIGLEDKFVIASQRTQAHANWVTVAPPGCQVEGAEGSCPLGGATIGVCSTSFNPQSGEILRTTAIMLQSFQDEVSQFSPEAIKISVFTHELGHCLGLQHVNSTQTDRFIMHPSAGGTDVPHPNELAAIFEGYRPVARPTSANALRFFSVRNGVVLRQFEIPTFVLSERMGEEAFAEEYNPDLGFALPAPKVPPGTITITHRLQRDGSCIEEVHDAASEPGSPATALR